jgi:hypothetical protein
LEEIVLGHLIKKMFKVNLFSSILFVDEKENLQKGSNL